jgi:hypothetical protein
MMNSEKIMSYLKDYRISIPVGVVLGLILGLVIGWGIWPVQWTDLAPYHLRPDLREDYLRMSIYTATTVGDGSIATKAWTELGDTAEETLEAVKNEPRYLNQQQITSFAMIVGAESTDLTPTTEVTGVVEEEEEGGGINWLLITGLCLVLLIAAGVIFYFFVLRERPNEGERKEVLPPRGRADNDYEFEGEAQRYVTQPESQRQSVKDEQTIPVAQFMSTYMIGDDLYDDSFSIDAPTGEFLGECGVGISETIGVGDPKKVTGFEVWLFDKNDIQTVTKVIMSAHAFGDDKIRTRLESKGEPILAEPGKQILLETATLQLEARVIDMEYGEGAAPDQSYFQRLTMELAVWPK